MLNLVVVDGLIWLVLSTVLSGPADIPTQVFELKSLEARATYG